jgi:putative ABC transport system ATP-binding protein
MTNAMTTGAPLIRLRGVSRSYGSGAAEVHALRAVDLDIVRGEYLFEGVAVHAMTRNERALLRRYQFGFVFQGFNLLPRTSAQENVELPLLYRGDSAASRRDAALRALASVGLEGREHHTPSELSGGQQQRVAIARALVTDPTVLLADEPTGNLDSQRSREIMELLRHLNTGRGITIVMVTHEPDMAAYARRIVRFVDGRIASDTVTAPASGLPAPVAEMA